MKKYRIEYLLDVMVWTPCSPSSTTKLPLHARSYAARVDVVAFGAGVAGLRPGRISIVTSPPPPSWIAPACTAALQIDESSVYGPLPIDVARQRLAGRTAERIALAVHAAQIEIERARLPVDLDRARRRRGDRERADACEESAGERDHDPKWQWATHRQRLLHVSASVFTHLPSLPSIVPAWVNPSPFAVNMSRFVTALLSEPVSSNVIASPFQPALTPVE